MTYGVSRFSRAFFPALCEGCGFVLSFDWVIDLFGHLFTLGQVTMEGTLKH